MLPVRSQDIGTAQGPSRQSYQCGIRTANGTELVVVKQVGLFQIRPIQTLFMPVNMAAYISRYDHRTRQA